jgi:hypothetical protein
MCWMIASVTPADDKGCRGPCRQPWRRCADTRTFARSDRCDSKTPMKPERIESIPATAPVPTILVSWWRLAVRASPPLSGHILVLVAGTVLALGKRTVTRALRVMGLADQPGFGRNHEALDRARWDAREVAHRLLPHLIAVLWPSGEVGHANGGLRASSQHLCRRICREATVVHAVQHEFS